MDNGDILKRENKKRQAIFEWADKCLRICKSKKYDDSQKLQSIINSLDKLTELYLLNKKNEILDFLEANNWMTLENKDNAEKIVDVYLKIYNDKFDDF